jgi:lipoprotein-anchoring transpeptidase ErfK/SrfK
VPEPRVRSEVLQRMLKCRRVASGRAGTLAAALLAVVAVTLAGCGNNEATYSGGSASPVPAVRTTPPPVLSPLASATGLSPYSDANWPSYVATPRASKLSIFSAPAGRVTRTMSDTLPLGVPLTLLVVGKRAGWVQVELPVRPNGSTGWARQSDVTLTGLQYGLVVERAEHRLLLYDRTQLLHTYSVGIGTSETPTPGGLYYLIELLRPPNPSGAYGPYAYGLSGFSEVIHHFNGGDGVIGLHGTNEPSLVGHDVSHGCIRLRNKDITYLAHLLPLGTPIRINA